jgi:hypothetical protein
VGTAEKMSAWVRSFETKDGITKGYRSPDTPQFVPLSPSLPSKPLRHAVPDTELFNLLFLTRRHHVDAVALVCVEAVGNGAGIVLVNRQCSSTVRKSSIFSHHETQSGYQARSMYRGLSFDTGQ